MKKVLFAAVALLLFAGCKSNGAQADAQTEDGVATEVVASDFAYVSVDAVIAQSDMFKTEGEPLRAKTEKAQTSWAQKERNLQTEAAQLQEKFEKGLITTRDAQAKQEELQKKAASYQNGAASEAKQLDEENIVFQNRMNDLMQKAIQAVNADKKYKMIVNASALLDAAEGMDITNVVLEKFNELYKQEQK